MKNTTFHKKMAKKAEAVKLKALAIQLKQESGDSMNLAEAMEKHLPGEDTYSILENLERGINDFYRAYAGNIDEEWTMERIERMVEGKTTEEQGWTLVNLMTALTCVGDGKLEADPLWMTTIAMYEEKLKGVEHGISVIEEEDIEKLKKMLFEQIEEVSILLYMDSAACSEIISACCEERPDEVKAVTVNTQEASLYIGAASYILYRKGELSFTEINSEEHAAYEIGLSVAAHLESDAVIKMGASGKISWEKAKELLKKISKIAVTLLLGIAVVSVSVMTGALLFTAISLLLRLTTFGILVAAVVSILGTVCVSMGLGAEVDAVKEMGAKILNVTVTEVKAGYAFLSRWLKETVIPKAKEIWQKCRRFLMEHIIEPARKAYEGAKAAREKAGRESEEEEVTDAGYDEEEDLVEEEPEEDEEEESEDDEEGEDDNLVMA